MENTPTPSHELDPHTAGHLAGDILSGALTSSAPNAAEDALKALNSNLAQYELEVGPIIRTAETKSEPYLIAERVAHIVEMGGLLNAILSREVRISLAEKNNHNGY